jgi:hypothetical protein
VDENDKLKQQIQEEEDRRQRLDMEVRKVTEQLRVIDSVLRSFCTRLQVCANNTTSRDTRNHKLKYLPAEFIIYLWVVSLPQTIGNTKWFRVIHSKLERRWK